MKMTETLRSASIWAYVYVGSMALLAPTAVIGTSYGMYDMLSHGLDVERLPYVEPITYVGMGSMVLAAAGLAVSAIKLSSAD